MTVRVWHLMVRVCVCGSQALLRKWSAREMVHKTDESTCLSIITIMASTEKDMINTNMEKSSGSDRERPKCGKTVFFHE